MATRLAKIRMMEASRFGTLFTTLRKVGKYPEVR